jgi:hypothetical protein
VTWLFRRRDQVIYSLIDQALVGFIFSFQSAPFPHMPGNSARIALRITGGLKVLRSDRSGVGFHPQLCLFTLEPGWKLLDFQQNP